MDKQTINVQVLDLNQQSTNYTVPLYSKLSVVLDKIECDMCDMTRLNPETILKHNDIIVLYPISDKCISINQSSLEELTTLPRIGPSTAQKIIDYRKEFGFFQKLEDIMTIKGIKTSIFNRIKDLICL